MKIYVASSWRNKYQQDVVRELRAAGHDVYDFRNPAPGDHGFAWSDIDPNWQKWTPNEFAEAIHHPIAEAGFAKDMKALLEADAVVLVLPCGRSAHVEAGRRADVTFVYSPEQCEPELMYRMFLGVFDNLYDIINRINEGIIF